MERPLRLFGSVLTDGQELPGCLVQVEGGQVTGLTRDATRADADLVVDEGWIAPGLIDLHLHGAGGVDLASASDPADAVAAVARTLACHGVTGFCPTLVTSSAERYLPFLRAFSPRAHAGGAASLGAYLEGPFLSPRYRGSHDAALLRGVALSEIEAWLQAAPPAIVTIAPELPGALAAIRWMADKGVTASLGHSAGDAEAGRAALAAGARLATHLFNAMPPLHHRMPGLVGALLASQATLEVIADGVHLDPLIVELVVRAAGPRRVAIVTDALAPAGGGPGPGVLGDQPVQSDGRAVRRLDGSLAGSATLLPQALRNLRAWLPWLPPADLVRMATETPAAALGRQAAVRKGRVAVGYDADLVLLDPAWRVRATYVRGRRVDAG